MNIISKNYYIIATILLLVIFSINKVGAYNTNKAEILAKCAHANSSKDIIWLQQLATYYSVITGEHEQADSVVSLIIKIAEKESNSELLIHAYQIYSTYCLPENYTEATIYLAKAESLAEKIDNNELKFKNIIATSLLLSNQGKTEEAIRELLGAKQLIKNEHSRDFLYHITLGDLFIETLDIHSTLDNYNTALEYASELDNDSLKYATQLKLIEFTLRNKLYHKTSEYIAKASEIIEKNPIFNEYDKLYLESLQQELIANVEANALYKKGIDLIATCNAKNFKVIEKKTFSNLRMSFMKSDNIKALCDLYCDKRSAENLAILEQDDPNMYFRILAFISENSNKIDSAKTYWQYSESLVLKKNNPAYTSNFYMRLGQFYVRQNMKMLAVDAFKKAYEFALKSNFLPFVIESSSRLDSAYYAVGDIGNAYNALRNNKIFIDSNAKILQQEKLFIMEQNSTKRLEAINDRIAKEAEERSNRLQLFMIGFFIFGLIFLLIFLSKRSISSSTLKFFGYITFVFLFEFFIFLLHNVFHSITHSPVWLMMMNVTLIALLLPIHHATEHHVLNYLMKKHRVEHKNETLFSTFKELIQKYKNWINVKEHEHEKEPDALL